MMNVNTREIIVNVHHTLPAQEFIALPVVQTKGFGGRDRRSPSAFFCPVQDIMDKGIHPGSFNVRITMKVITGVKPAGRAASLAPALKNKMP